MQTRTQTAIAARFAQLLDRITPDSSEERVFVQHQSSIETRLKATFKTNRVERIGSYTRGSAIKRSSDVDLLLILSRDEVRRGNEYKSSNTVLNNLRDQLQDRYTRTEIGRDGQAVVISFGDGQHPVDVVPGFYWEAGPNNYPVFCIPDGEGQWMKTAPQLHNKYIAAGDQRSAGKLKGAARLTKFWAGLRASTESLTGFHVEMLLAQTDICAYPQSHATLFRELMRTLASRRCRALQDPLGVSGYIKIAGTSAKQMSLDSTIQGIVSHCQSATKAEESFDTQEAIRQWNIVLMATSRGNKSLRKGLY